MNKGAFGFLIAALLVYPVLIFGNGGNDLCAHKDHPLACLEANFEELYSSDYHRFWKIMREGAAKAEKCDSVSNTTAFLELAVLKTNNAEFNEFLSEVIERLVSDKTDCFLAAARKADMAAQEKIIGRLRHPIYVDIGVIDNNLKSRIDSEYRPLIDLYLREKR